MVNEKDYNNALRIIKECKKYVDEKMAKYKGAENFDEIKLMKIDTDNTYHRGGGTTWLVVRAGYQGLCTNKICGDGTQWQKDISTSENPYIYAYNASKQTTIDLAVMLATKWEFLKRNIDARIADYELKQKENTDILENFHI